MTAKKIGLLTGGGHGPGLDAAIRAVVRRAQSFSMEVVGVALEQFADAEVFFG